MKRITIAIAIFVVVALVLYGLSPYYKQIGQIWDQQTKTQKQHDRQP